MEHRTGRGAALAAGLALLAACGSPEEPGLADEASSVMACARLQASGTQPRGFWPFEAEDAVATVRDSDPATGFKVPWDEPAWIEVDLLPLLARPVPLSGLSVAFEGPPPPGLAVELAPACGAPPVSVLPWDDAARPLDLLDAPAGCLRILLPAGEGHVVTALDLTSRARGLPCAGPAAGDVRPPSDRARDSGVIEGFYGVPWSWRERRHMVMALAREGLGTFLYAPKDDPLHRDRWREPYPEEDLRRFADLADLARALDVRFAFGISPFLDYRPGEEDYGILLAKARALAARGATVLALLADDIEFAPGVTVDGALGDLHVAVANRLAADLAADGLALWFCPTVYSDARARDWPGGTEYLARVAGLDPSVAVLWTGPETGNATLRASDLAAVTAATGRPPVIWDNRYANDGGDGAFGRIFLSPWGGRDPDLPGATRGIALNQSIQGALSRLSLATFGAWRADPAGASPEALRDHAVAREALFAPGRERDAAFDAAVLRRVLHLFDGDSSRDPPRFVALEEASAALGAALGALGRPGAPAFEGAEAAAMLALLASLAALPSDAHHSGLDTDLVDELAFPLRKAYHEGRQGLWALSALSLRLAGQDASEALSRAADEALLSAQCRFLFSPDAVADLAAAVQDAPALSPAPAPLAAAEAPPAACRAGQPLQWRPFEAGARVEAFGLPGATAGADGVVRWTPPHGGRFRGVVTGVRTGPGPAWAWVDAAFDCAGTDG